MIPSAELVSTLDRHGFRRHTGVPCSYFAGVIAQLSAERRYVAAANEGAALALAAGATAAGTRTSVFAQNSGFGNLLNPLTSLVMPYRLPALVFMTLRGWPDPDGDEPQHRVMGEATHRLLDGLGVWHATLTADAGDLRVVDEAVARTERGRPAFVLVEKGALGAEATRRQSENGRLERSPSRRAAIAAAVDGFPDALLVSTTGYASRELFALADSDRCFYLQGSMGHASAFGLGVALAIANDRTVVVLDGDGAALMHMGSMSTVGATAPPNLVHVILDNGAYESTGRQPTSSKTTSFAGVGRAAGYRTAVDCRTVAELRAALETAARTEGPHLIATRVAVSAGAPPPRATSAIAAPEIHSRFATAARAAG